MVSTCVKQESWESKTELGYCPAIPSECPYGLTNTPNNSQGARNPGEAVRGGQHPEAQTLRSGEKCSGGTRRTSSIEDSFTELMQSLWKVFREMPGL